MYSITNNVSLSKTNSNNTAQGDRISLIEKIMRLPELFDPALAPIETIPFLGKNFGYNVGLNVQDIKEYSGVNPDPEAIDRDIEAKKYLRFMIANLSEWYRTKTTAYSDKTMLYSFGLVGDIVYYYTNHYQDPNASASPDASPSQQFRFLFESVSTYKELYNEVCKKIHEYEILGKSVDQVTADAVQWILTQWTGIDVEANPSNIPDQFFPTPHYMLWFDAINSLDDGSYQTESDRLSKIRDAMEATRPINGVFDGICAYFNLGGSSQIFFKQVSRTFDEIVRLPANTKAADGWKV